MKLDSQVLTIDFIQKSRQKHCYIRLKGNNLVQVSANRHFSQEDAKNLVLKKSAWILKHVQKQNSELCLNEFYYLGEKHALNGRDRDKFYKEKALELLPLLVDKHAKIMQLFPSKLSFRKNKTRFGSCSSKNAISLNILLMKFPQEVIEYVIIHELAHIKHKNHSKAFWQCVEQFCPNYKVLDKQLKGFNQPF